MATVRCDACFIAGARIRAVKGRMQLYFCQHHGFQYADSLHAQGWTLLTKKARPKAGNDQPS